MTEAQLLEIEEAHPDCTDRVGCYALAMVDEIRLLSARVAELESELSARRIYYRGTDVTP